MHQFARFIVGALCAALVALAAAPAQAAPPTIVKAPFGTLADGTASVINSSLAHFADEYEEHVRLGRCPLREESVEVPA